MRVLHLISGGDVGGAKTHVLSLLSGLLSRADIRLVTFTEGPFADEARACGIPLTVLDGGVRSTLAALETLVWEGGYDIVHSHGSRGNLMAGLLSRRIRVPTVSTIHSDYRHDYLGRPLARLTYGTLNKWALRRLDYRIGVSRRMTNILCDRGFSPSRLFTVYNGLDFSQPSPVVDREAFWAERGFFVSPGDVLVGIAARLSLVKDMATLLRAFAGAAADCPGLKLVIAGEGELRAKLEAQAREANLPDRVFFAGWLDDMAPFYSAIDINVLTSLTETFPYALLEGVRAKLPTVATRVGGISALIDDRVNGYLIRPGDAGTLADRLRALYGGEALRADMGRRLFNKASVAFSIDNMLDTQMGIYRVILRRDKRPPRARDRVVICGAYGRNNAGDDAILEGILRELRAIDPDRPVTVVSRNPRQTRRTFGADAVHTFNLFGVWGALRRAALLLSGGGSLIQNVTSNRSLWYYLGVIALSARLGARVLMYGCGVGPLSGGFSRRLTARVLNKHVHTVTLREDSSLRDLERLKVTKPRLVLSADPALVLRPSSSVRVDSLLLAQDIPIGGNYIAFSLRRWPGFEARADAFAAAADYAQEKYGLTPLFIPIEKRGDVGASSIVARKVKGEYHLLSRTGPAGDVIGLLGRCRAVVAMRLHALIFASGQGLPLVGVAYDDKVTAFLRYMGQKLYTPFASADAPTLCRLIDQAMAEGDERAARLAAVARLRELEARNVEVLREMLEESSWRE
jgi:polysaccharide pyruvyl transferase CsaB